jgi:hypothetical protein
LKTNKTNETVINLFAEASNSQHIHTIQPNLIIWLKQNRSLDKIRKTQNEIEMRSLTKNMRRFEMHANIQPGNARCERKEVYCKTSYTVEAARKKLM